MKIITQESLMEVRGVLDYFFESHRIYEISLLKLF